MTYIWWRVCVFNTRPMIYFSSFDILHASILKLYEHEHIVGVVLYNIYFLTLHYNYSIMFVIHNINIFVFLYFHNIWVFLRPRSKSNMHVCTQYKIVINYLSLSHPTRYSLKLYVYQQIVRVDFWEKTLSPFTLSSFFLVAKIQTYLSCLSIVNIRHKKITHVKGETILCQNRHGPLSVSLRTFINWIA